MPEKGWKRAERVIAEMLHGKRIPVTGRTRGDAPDVAHPDLSIEVKHWKKIPGKTFMNDAMDQAVKSADDTQIPIVVAHSKGQSYGESMVYIRLDDFIERFLDDDGRLKTKWTQMDSPLDVPGFKDTAYLFSRDVRREL